MPEIGPAAPYPETARERNRWILGRRGERNTVGLDRPHGFFHEREPDETGRVGGVNTVLLTNRECPWKCVMCDLWKNTTPTVVPAGSIARQIGYALERLPHAETIKLYNSGSFFDSGAISIDEWEEIAGLCRGFRRVIVECHPRLVSEQVLQFTAMLTPKLEVAMGLETANEKALHRLNKGITVEDFSRAASFLTRNGIAVRTFLLVNPPFIPAGEQEFWLGESVEKAFDAGSSVVSLIPARAGNGAMEALSAAGEFHEPRLQELEEGFERALASKRGRVFVDLWDLERFSRCGACFDSRRERLQRMNLSQKNEPAVDCRHCDD